MNVLTELIAKIPPNTRINCGFVKYTSIKSEGEFLNEKTLSVNHSLIDNIEFLRSLNYVGYKSTGTVWLKDGSWLELDSGERGLEWTRYVCPEIPENLK